MGSSSIRQATDVVVADTWRTTDQGDGDRSWPARRVNSGRWRFSGGTRRSLHFSLTMHAERRLTRWVAWNIDGPTRGR